MGLTQPKTYLKLTESLNLHAWRAKQYQKLSNLSRGYEFTAKNPYQTEIDEEEKRLHLCYHNLGRDIESYLTNHKFPSCERLLKKYDWEIKEHMNFDPRPNAKRTAGLWFNGCERIVVDI